MFRRWLLLLLVISCQANAQFIIKTEYFIDNDPGFGNGIPVTNTGTSLLTQSLIIPTTSINSGQHILYIRTLDNTGVWSLAEPRVFTVVPSLADVEYFIDNDPGQGNGNQLFSGLYADSINKTADVPTAGVSSGQHILYIRTRDNNGKWSLAEPRSFTIRPSINRVEYFFDTDPGFGQANYIGGYVSSDSINITKDIFTGGLYSGEHRLYIRTCDNDGRWSLSEPRLITIKPSFTTAEYFFDTDPGPGNGTAIPGVTAADSINLNFSVNTDALLSGNHILYVRSRDSDGKWSLAEPRSVMVNASLVAGEYFFDTDPGFGNGRAINGFLPKDSLNQNFDVNTSNLASGNHILYIRMKDSNGKWSLSEPRNVNIKASIVSAEYFFDTDPGFGNATEVAGITVSDSINENVAVITTSLLPGDHKLYFRTLDSDGKWSLAEPRTIRINPSLVAAEYFFDNDPGLGNGTAVSGITTTDSLNHNFTVYTNSLSAGNHLLYVRTRDNNGKWSIAEPRPLTIRPSLVAAEYFFDTDPGIGYAAPINNFTSTDSINYNVVLPTASLSSGTHRLYIRTRDSNGKWSLSEPRSFNITNDSALFVKAFIQGFYLGNGQMTAVIDPVNLPGICDVVTIGLASSAFPFNSVHEQTTFLSTTGMATITLPAFASGNSYYIYIKGRNFIETWSKYPVTTGNLSLFNFTASPSF